MSDWTRRTPASRERVGSSEDDDDGYNNDKPFQPRKMKKTITAAVLLFLTGSLMLYFGVQLLPTEKDRAIGMLVTGSLAFLPGTYASWIILGSWLGWRGYDMHELPSYDDN